MGTNLKANDELVHQLGHDSSTLNRDKHVDLQRSKIAINLLAKRNLLIVISK